MLEQELIAKKNLSAPERTRSDHIMAAMAEVGWAKKGTWLVDLLKVPHHGSNRNVTHEFFAKVPARHYVVSGNGK